MEISYLGHASFLIEAKTGSGKVKIVLDPYDPKMVGLPFKKVEANLVLVSHDHGDHNRSDQIGGDPYLISGPGEYEVKGVKVTGIPSFHDEAQGTKRGKNTIYVLEAEGIFVCHLGDLGHSLSDEQVSLIGKVDVLLVPVGGFYTLDAPQALAVVSQLEPLIVVPMHYKVPGLSKSLEVLADVSDFLKEVGQEASREKILKIEKNSLPQEEMRVVVLERSA